MTGMLLSKCHGRRAQALRVEASAMDREKPGGKREPSPAIDWHRKHAKEVPGEMVRKRTPRNRGFESSFPLGNGYKETTYRKRNFLKGGNKKRRKDRILLPIRRVEPARYKIRRMHRVREKKSGREKKRFRKKRVLPFS